MIYVGVLNIIKCSENINNLFPILKPYIKSKPKIIKKDNLNIVCGKLLNIDDMQKVWTSKNSILIGRVLNKSQEHVFLQKNFENLSSLNKNDFLKKIWGEYIYIKHHKQENQFDIIVDPAGNLSFFYYILPSGNILFSSDIVILFKVIGRKLNYNLSYLCSYTVFGNSSSIQTPFKNIFEVPPGCILKITNKNLETKVFWNPLNYCKKNRHQATSASDVMNCTLVPWVHPYKNVCVSLSGGLDSSSIVYSLKNNLRENQVLTALNYFHSSVKSSNELVHARRVCEETGISLIEIDASTCLPFSAWNKSLLPLPPNKPSPSLNNLKCLEVINNHLPIESCIFLSGHGSDHIFMCPPSKKSVADYIIENGFAGSRLKLKEIALFYRDSFFQILWENIISVGEYSIGWRLNKRHSKNILRKLPKWIKKELYQKTANDFLHPIYNCLPNKTLPGKYEQIDMLYEVISSVHDKLSNTSYPFLFTPMIEFSLSFPTYELFKEGYDRYPIRQSFSQLFNTKKLWRRDKSQTTGVLQLGVKKNLSKVLSLCTEGYLVKQGLVDKSHLYETINLISNGDKNHLWSFMFLSSTENFLKLWDQIDI